MIKRQLKACPALSSSRLSPPGSEEEGSRRIQPTQSLRLKVPKKGPTTSLVALNTDSPPSPSCARVLWASHMPDTG